MSILISNSLWQIQLNDLLLQQGNKHLSHNELTDELVVTVRSLIILVFFKLCLVNCNLVLISSQLFLFYPDSPWIRSKLSLELLVLF